MTTDKAYANVMEEKDFWIDRALYDFKKACEESDDNLKNNKNNKNNKDKKDKKDKKDTEKIPLEIFENLQAYVTFDKQQDVDDVIMDQEEEL